MYRYYHFQIQVSPQMGEVSGRATTVVTHQGPGEKRVRLVKLSVITALVPTDIAVEGCILDPCNYLFNGPRGVSGARPIPPPPGRRNVVGCSTSPNWNPFRKIERTPWPWMTGAQLRSLQETNKSVCDVRPARRKPLNGKRW